MTNGVHDPQPGRFPQAHGFETLAIHAGQEPEPRTGAVVPPIYQTSTYAQDAVGAPRLGYEYSRTANPTRDALQECLAALEGGRRGARLRQRAGRRGHPAAGRVPAGRPRGDPGRRVRRHVPAVRQGGPALGPDLHRRRTLSDVDAVRAAMHRPTRIVWVETPTNPLLGIADIAALAAGGARPGRAAGGGQHLRQPVPAAAAGPRRRRGGALDHQVRRRPLRRGRRRAGRRATTSSASELAFHQNAMGAISGPFDAWLTLRGIKTLGVRMDRHCDNAERVVDYLSRHRAVAPGALPGPARAPGARGRGQADAPLRRHGQLPAAGGEAARSTSATGPSCSCWASRWAASSR